MLSHVDETWKLFAEHSEHFSCLLYTSDAADD